MKTYIAQRPADDEIGDCRVFVEDDGVTLQNFAPNQMPSSALIGRPQPHPLHHVKLHSEGFEWGYSGSGPADLALSILADHLGERPSRRQLHHGECRCWPLHQAFKRAFIAGAPHAGFKVTGTQIDDWLSSQTKEA